MVCKVAIVGLGNVGMGYDLGSQKTQTFRSHSGAFHAHPDFSLVAGIDPDIEKREKFESEFGSAYSDIQSACGEKGPDLVVIASPTSHHFDHLKSVLSCCSPKIILCEKPLSNSVEEASQMVSICKDKGSQLFVNYMRRSDPAVIQLHNQIKTGAIASPIKVNAWYTKGFFHNASHLFNLLEFWLGDVKNASLVKKAKKWGRGDVIADVYIEFEKGDAIIRASLENEYDHFCLELLAPSGRLSYNDGGSSIETPNH